MRTIDVHGPNVIDNFELIKDILGKYYPKNRKIRAELYVKWLKAFFGLNRKPEKKLVYVDIQKWFKESKQVYEALLKNPSYLASFDNRCRIYDSSNSIHCSFWCNPYWYWKKDSFKRLMIDEEIEKQFWYLRFKETIPVEMKKDLEKYFSKDDHIVLVGWYRDKCLQEIYDTFKLLWYRDVKINDSYIY